VAGGQGSLATATSGWGMARGPGLHSISFNSRSCNPTSQGGILLQIDGGISLCRFMVALWLFVLLECLLAVVRWSSRRWCFGYLLRFDDA
jgi:hypothetical protein